LTGALIAPGDPKYAEVAVRQTVLLSELGSTRNVTGVEQLNGGLIYAPYIIANGTQQQFLGGGRQRATAYFAFEAANTDRADHIQLLENNTFGFEDLNGGGERGYNDIVFQIDLTVAT
jgi:hypothetical protein